MKTTIFFVSIIAGVVFADPDWSSVLKDHVIFAPLMKLGAIIEIESGKVLASSEPALTEEELSTIRRFFSETNPLKEGDILKAWNVEYAISSIGTNSVNARNDLSGFFMWKTEKTAVVAVCRPRTFQCTEILSNAADQIKELGF